MSRLHNCFRFHLSTFVVNGFVLVTASPVREARPVPAVLFAILRKKVKLKKRRAIKCNLD